MKTYCKKPVEVEAVQLTKTNFEEVCNWSGADVSWTGNGVLINTLEGTMLAGWGDWIIKGVKQEFYPCKDDVFVATYEAV